MSAGASSTAPPFDEASLARYERRGWAHLPGFLDVATLESWKAEAGRLCACDELFEGSGRGTLLVGQTRRDRLDPVIDVSPVYAAAATGPLMLGAAEAVLGRPAQLFKDKFIAKPPGAPGYGAHQDLTYWPGFAIDPDLLVTIVVFLDASDADNGALEVTSGQHRSWLTPRGVVADPQPSQLGRFHTVVCDAGDAVLLHPLTPHRSGQNTSDHMRRTVLLTYAADDTPNLWGAYQASR
jgi:2-aminoethylphosphonate dioxygenase